MTLKGTAKVIAICVFWFLVIVLSNGDGGLRWSSIKLAFHNFNNSCRTRGGGEWEFCLAVRKAREERLRRQALEEQVRP